jgi:uroporphyrin-III C-methyltransferase
MTTRPRRPHRPWCALVGAGPGDPELLTLKALRTLRRASVLLVDDLVSPAIVKLALAGRRSAPRVVHVGKRGGCRSTPQAFIEKLMLHEALAGERVVRVKGGDPFIFGRGGEEAAALRAHGVTVEVVNGITAGLAAATGIGVPLTHRDHAQGVMLVTGHAREGGRAPDWAVLGAAAAQGLTLVVYMGMARLVDLQAGLLQALPARTPVAVVQHASLPTQRHAVGRLDGLAQMVATHRLASPAVLIVGDVLQGWAQLPLATASCAAAA